MKKRIIPNKRSIKAKLAAGILLGLALVTGFSGVPNTRMTENPYVAEAKSKKKDKKKPVITFKDKKIKEVEQGKKVKNLGVTAKDNVDGNVTKKVKVTVKRGKKKYSTIAKKIKNNKSVEFKDTGTYKITYTVTDKAGNKATKTRTIKVLAPKKKTTETPTTEITTEIPTTEQPTTEQPTVEKPTTGIYQETVNGIKYNVTRDFNLFDEKISNTSTESDKIKINIENDYDRLQLDAKSKLTKNSQYLKFLGNITATDENGEDISNNIVISEIAFLDPIINSFIYTIYIYVEDNNGNSLKKDLDLYFRSFDSDLPYKYDNPEDLILLNKNPLVYGRLRVEENNLSLSTEKQKCLSLLINRKMSIL